MWIAAALAPCAALTFQIPRPEMTHDPVPAEPVASAAAETLERLAGALRRLPEGREHQGTLELVASELGAFRLVHGRGPREYAEWDEVRSAAAAALASPGAWCELPREGSAPFSKDLLVPVDWALLAVLLELSGDGAQADLRLAPSHWDFQSCCESHLLGHLARAECQRAVLHLLRDDDEGAIPLLMQGVFHGLADIIPVEPSAVAWHAATLGRLQMLCGDRQLGLDLLRAVAAQPEAGGAVAAARTWLCEAGDTTVPTRKFACLYLLPQDCGWFYDRVLLLGDPASESGWRVVAAGLWSREPDTDEWPDFAFLDATTGFAPMVPRLEAAGRSEAVAERIKAAMVMCALRDGGPSMAAGTPRERCIAQARVIMEGVLANADDVAAFDFWMRCWLGDGPVLGDDPRGGPVVILSEWSSWLVGASAAESQ